MAALFPLGLTFTEQLTLSDTGALGYGFLISDQLSLSDAVSSTYVLLITDQLVLSDNISIQELGALISIFPSDQLTMSDGTAFGYGLLPSDQLLLSEQTILGYGSLVHDQLIQTDAFSYAYVLFVTAADQITLSDALVTQLQALSSFAETLVFSDNLVIGIGNQITDQMVMADAPVFGFTLNLNDQMNTLSEQVGAGYGNATSDQITTQSDQLAFVESMLIQIADATPAQLDALASLFTFGLQINDAVVFQEQLTTLWGLITGDSLALVDQLNPQLIGPLYLALTDQDAANWLDAVLTQIVFAPSAIVLHSISVEPELQITAFLVTRVGV
jgi:hypothetical protein